MCLGIPGKIESITSEPSTENDERRGLVNFSGAIREVYLGLVPEAQVGDYVIVHVGVALSRLDEAAAKQTLELIQELGEEVSQ